MASGWANRLPRVTVRQTETPKAVTLIYPYYNAPAFLLSQFDRWVELTRDDRLRDYLRVIVVDDGSTRQAIDAFASRRITPSPLVRLFRIEQDVPWNWLAARNIGARHAPDGWLLLTDMDHVVDGKTLRAIVYGAHDPSVVYAFSRIEHTGETIAPHSASFLMTREMFWRIGGYDERLSGVYGTDGLYRTRVAATAPIRVLTDSLIRHEYVSDASVDLPRKTPAMREARAHRLASVAIGTPPLVCSFPYHEVTA